MQTIPVKILGYKKSQRYPIWRTLQQAQITFEKEHPGWRLDVQEVTTSAEIMRYTPVIAFPSLVIDQKLVCVGRFPSRMEVSEWLNAVISETKIFQPE